MSPKKKKIMIVCIIVSVLLVIGITAWGISSLLGAKIGGETESNVEVDEIIEDKGQRPAYRRGRRRHQYGHADACDDGL